MAKSKEQLVGELEVLLKDKGEEEVISLLANYMSGAQLSEFTDFVKEEYGALETITEEEE